MADTAIVDVATSDGCTAGVQDNGAHDSNAVYIADGFREEGIFVWYSYSVRLYNNWKYKQDENLDSAGQRRETSGEDKYGYESPITNFGYCPDTQKTSSNALRGLQRGIRRRGVVIALMEVGMAVGKARYTRTPKNAPNSSSHLPS
ncbi:uncharacterized protein PAC_15398 [Phialocephala subalpina]|uniref:Uncharacterized protein n=1 Tax=Phialocephala subalpina TaxID=576137 RepID=A0A1L7XKF4_9HELO|nr:uncharacterized protein PAC_15398 [Phialocephala subalpina]